MACAVAIAGCGSGDDGGSGGAGTVTFNPELSKEGPDHGWSQTNVTLDPSTLACNKPAQDPNRGVTPTSVRIGGLASVTSPAGVAFGDTVPGAQVRFARANDEGGVHGRKIDYLEVRDDASDPGRSADQARALAERDQPFAALVNTSGPNYADALCDAVIPYFGWGNSPAYCGNAIGFGITGCQTPAQTGQRTVNTGGALQISRLVPEGAPRTLALVGLDNESARQGNITVGQGFESAGFKVVYQKSPIPLSGLADATPIVRDLMTADGGKPPAAVFMVAQFGDTVKLTGALKAAGFEGVIVSPLYDPRVASVPELDDSYALMQWQPALSTDVPAIAQMVADFRKYSPDTTLGLMAMVGYWSADMLIRALDRTGPDLTVDSFLNTLNRTDYVNYVEGALPETRWPLNHIASSPCGTLVHLKDGAWNAPPLSCGVITKAP